MSFPKRIYTLDEVHLAKSLIEQGHKHRLKVLGNATFKRKTEETLKLVKVAKHDDFLRMYIRSIREVEGFSQLREEEASIWVNSYLFEDLIDAASFFIQKASQMKNYLEGKIYYGQQGETEAIDSRIKFLESLKKESNNLTIKKECEKKLKMWHESKFF